MPTYPLIIEKGKHKILIRKVALDDKMTIKKLLNDAIDDYIVGDSDDRL